jgi:hypothetical protein
VARDVAWPLRSREHLTTVEPPTATDLDLLRHRLDPDRLFLRPDR